MEVPGNRKASLGLNSSLKALISYVILLALFHAADYMIMFKNDILFFFVSHNVITTLEGDSFLSSNYLFAICLLFFIPVSWILTKKFSFNSIRKE